MTCTVSFLKCLSVVLFFCFWLVLACFGCCGQFGRQNSWLGRRIIFHLENALSAKHSSAKTFFKPRLGFQRCLFRAPSEASYLYGGSFGGMKQSIDGANDDERSGRNKRRRLQKGWLFEASVRVLYIL